MRDRPKVTGSGLALVLMIASVLVAGCSRDGFEDRTAVVEVGEETVRFQLDSCGLDDATLFLVGRSDGGEVLQAVVALTEDEVTGDPAGTGLTVGVETDTYAAFGPASWALRDGLGEPPGTISWSRLRGARIRVVGEVERVDENDRPVMAGEAELVPLTLDARCDDREVS